MPRSVARRPAGVRVFRHATLGPQERTVRAGIPVTTVARTLLDLATVLRPWGLRRAIEQAENLELFDLRAIEGVVTAHRGRPAAPALARVVADLARHGTTLTRSELEARFLHGCIQHGLPRPVVNRVDEDGYELDFRWPAARLVIETNGYGFHRSRAAFERDHVKRFALEAAGHRVVSLTWRQIVDRPEAVFARLRDLLAAPMSSRDRISRSR